MSSRRLSWSAALRDLRADRAARPAVREEPLRTAARIDGEPGLALTAWRGRSGRRYVCAIHPLAPDALTDRTPAVVLAVRRSDIGPAVLISVEAFEADGEGLATFHVARAAGATELHVHRLARTADARAAIVADLHEPEPPA